MLRRPSFPERARRAATRWERARREANRWERAAVFLLPSCGGLAFLAAGSASAADKHDLLSVLLIAVAIGYSGGAVIFLARRISPFPGAFAAQALCFQVGSAVAAYVFAHQIHEVRARGMRPGRVVESGLEGYFGVTPEVIAALIIAVAIERRVRPTHGPPGRDTPTELGMLLFVVLALAASVLGNLPGLAPEVYGFLLGVSLSGFLATLVGLVFVGYNRAVGK